MFNSFKKIQFIDYQDSYYYQQKRKKQRKKWLKYILLIVLLACLVVVIIPLAQSTNFNEGQSTEHNTTNENPLIYSPQLIFNHPDKKNNVSLPIDITASIEVSGLIAYTQIKQVFINPHPLELDGKYQFPMPENAAIKHLTVKVGDNIIIGQIMEKQAAKKAYNKAKTQGKKASLVQQQRANLFTNNIANIPPRSAVTVTLTFIMPVTFLNNELNINLPLAMTTRYQPMHYNESPAEHSAPSSSANYQAANSSVTQVNSYELIDAGASRSQSSDFDSSTLNINSFTANELNFGGANSEIVAKSQAAISVVLNAGVAVSSIKSASHQINTKPINNLQSEFLISLAKAKTLTNKNFNLTWQLEPSQQPQISTFTEKVGEEYFTLLTFFPPSTDKPAVFSRDVIFIIDTSGSMQGSSMIQAKQSLQHAISLLNSSDSFNIIAFNDSVDLLFSSTQMVTSNTVNQALKFIQRLKADGGTEMYRPLSQALIMAKNSEQSEQAIRQVVFITDGAVANEFELMQLLDGAQHNFRLFTIGIGAAPNGYFMKKAAQFGRGSYLYIQNSNEVQSHIATLMTKISQPALSDIALIVDSQIHHQVEVFPKKPTDLYLGEPMQVAIKSALPLISVQLTGKTKNQPWYQQLIIDDNQPSKGISTLWARSKIEDLLDGLVKGIDKEQVKKQVIATSITHQIISPYTSFIAIEKQPQVNTSLSQTAKNAIERSSAQTDNLLIAMPKTALGWQQQFLLGLLLMIIALLTIRLRAK
ncbi:marine proteobacterial sortase target protein [Thalassotalea piscium]|uniref:Ca-activated chloride channel family protein n=1 Tax=Thalassotalea piscium TaxID=1230533 RepID=A0A7X0NJG0_9GAMM|nr:marine proteobacterial sortase target protein [Thalassotalea piscium]MBB6544540.1 Ca-activated chloride channel family protein [Thalassotalea piscium]